MEFQNSYSLIEAYAYLEQKGFENESNEIRASQDKYKSYSSTLRRAKIIFLIKENNLLEDFCNKVWPSGLSDKGKSRIKFFEDLIYRFKASQEGTSEEEDESEIEKEENSFAFENDLKNYLIKNLFVIEKGLKLYTGENGKTGDEFYIPGTSRRIDILAVDEKNVLVVIELKVSRGHEKVIGQVLYYQSMIKTELKKDKVRAIIIAKEISPELKAATLYLKDVELYEYQLSMLLNKIK